VQVSGIHHVALKAIDVEKTAAFYRDVLGLVEVARHTDDRGALRSIWVSAEGDPLIVMIERSTAGGTTTRRFLDDLAGDARSKSSLPPPPATPAARFACDPPGLHLLAFRIAASEREAWRERLGLAGCAIVHETRFTLYALDPEGNRVGLSSFPDPR
jgi:catechol 2,3-dioxygenase-like lactoylglutathione lyase family enzyme